MTRKKTASRKKASDQKENIENEKSQEKPAYADMMGYDKLVQQTMDVWQEQLAHYLNNPEAMQELSKALEPAGQLFTQGIDLWFAMMEQFGKAANSNDKETAASAWHTQQQKYAADRATPASALSGASAYAVAELTRRLAELEKRFAEYEGSAGGGKTAAPKSAGKKKAHTAGLESAPKARRARQRKV